MVRRNVLYSLLLKAFESESSDNEWYRLHTKTNTDTDIDIQVFSPDGMIGFFN